MAKELKAGAVEILWPVTQASADPSNFTTLDADGNVLTKFAQASIPSIAMGPLSIVRHNAASIPLTLADAGKVLISDYAADATVTIPLESAVSFPVGTVIEFVDGSATGRLIIRAAAGVGLLYNSTLGAGSDGILGGGDGAQVRLRGVITSCRILKQASNNWLVFGDVVSA